MLTPEDISAIQRKLWVLLDKRTESYTMGDSSSVRVEMAEELLKSACFIIGLNFDAGADSETIKKLLVSEDYDVLFKTGFNEVKSRVKIGEALYEKAAESMLAIDNHSYMNTCKALKTFFKQYDIYNFAHEIPCVIDYPLALPVSEKLQGIDYINEYLRRYILENEFCGRFDAETVIMLLKSNDRDYRDNLLNIYEAVAANALGLTLLKGNIYALDITDNDRGKLYARVRMWKDSEAGCMLQEASAVLCSRLDLPEMAAAEYLAETVAARLPRLTQAMKIKRLEAIFPSLYREPKEKKTSVTYLDGTPMDNEALRDLIDEITECRLIADKILLVKQNVHSLRDYAEILGICFWDGESEALFDALNKDELEMLSRYVKHQQNRYSEWGSETGWETRLAEYLNKQK